MATTQTNMTRSAGVDVVGDIPWGTHFCLFYDTKSDLLETLVPYCKAGLQNQEFCLWVVAPPVTKEDALEALRQAVPGFDGYLLNGGIELISARDWYLQDGTFDLGRVIAGWNETLRRASAGGYVGVRVTGDTAWLETKHWKDFCEYEESLNGAIANQRMAVLCTYPLAACGAGEILDVVRTHQFAVTRRRGSWDIIETAGHKQAKAEIKRLNEELEQRVIERTSQLAAVNNELTKEIADRQHAENVLRRTEAYLVNAQRLIKTGSWAWDPRSDQMLHCSDEVYRIFDLDLQERVPSMQVLLKRVHPEDRDRVRKETAEGRFTTGDTLEYRLLLPDGGITYVITMRHPIFDKAERLVEIIGTVIDVTERRAAEVELERLHRLEADLTQMNRVSMLGELGASLAHEIKQPIAAASTNARTGLRWLQRNPADIAEAREALSRIVKDVNRAAEIIDRNRSLYRRDKPKRETVNLNELVREMIALLRDVAGRHSIAIGSELDGSLPAISADRVQMLQVLMNLMLNGIEAMKETGGELTITSNRTEDDQILLSVSDSGVGLPVEETDQIFDAFFTTKEQGTGMGLSISRRIIESHGGRLWASANPRRGAIFHFALPVDPSFRLTKKSNTQVIDSRRRLTTEPKATANEKRRAIV